MKARFVLGLLGSYYFITGLWGIVSIESFMDIVWGQRFELHAIFLMHTLSGFFLTFGLLFMYFAFTKIQFSILKVAIVMTFSVSITEFVYFDHIQQGLLVYDLPLELMFGLLLGYFAIKYARN